VQLAYELRDTAIKVNSADPATPRPISTGIAVIRPCSKALLKLFACRSATEEGPTGGFFVADCYESIAAYYCCLGVTKL
jgi:hypothetical protein